MLIHASVNPTYLEKRQQTNSRDENPSLNRTAMETVQSGLKRLGFITSVAIIIRAVNKVRNSSLNELFLCYQW